MTLKQKQRLIRRKRNTYGRTFTAPDVTEESREAERRYKVIFTLLVFIALAILATA